MTALDQRAETTADDAIGHMVPIARRLTNAVRDHDQRRVTHAIYAAARIDCPTGQNPLAVLAIVLADELATTLNAAANPSIRAERDRCLALAVELARAPIGELPHRARRLPTLIAQGTPA
jgi:hypothetical protein